MIFEGGNQVAAGVPRAWYGTPFNTPFNETLQTFGMSPQAANYTEAVLGWVSTGLAWKSLDAAPAIKTTSSVTGNVVMGGANFANEAKVLEHFEKHGSAFGANTANEYLQVGKDIMQNGQKIEYFYKPAGEMRTGYVQFMGNSSNGTAKFGFVGTNADGAITTIHAESGKSFWNMLNGSPTNKVINLVP
jgi:filamentous hemagglutinin